MSRRTCPSPERRSGEFRCQTPWRDTCREIWSAQSACCVHLRAVTIGQLSRHEKFPPSQVDIGSQTLTKIGHFSRVDSKLTVRKETTIKGVVITGNTAKLPGLQAFIGKKVDVAVIEMNAFKRLKGSTVTASPTFKNNMLSFANCYGLCLQ